MKSITTLILFFTITLNVFPSPNSEQKNINVAALKGPTGLSMVKLIHDNTQLSDNSETQYNIVNTPQLVTAGILSGEYDIAALPTNLAAIIYNKKPDYTLIAVTGKGTLYILSSRDDIDGFKALRNKKVYNIAKSSTPGFLLNHLLTKNNIDPNNDTEVNYTFNHSELASMLIANKVETGVLPEPFVTKVLINNKNMKIVADFQEEYKRVNNLNSSFPLSCIVAKKSLLKSNPELIQNFIIRLEESISWVNSNPQQAGELGKRVNLGIDGSIIEKSIERLNLQFSPAKEARENLHLYFNILFESNPKSVGGKIPEADFYMSDNKDE